MGDAVSEFSDFKSERGEREVSEGQGKTLWGNRKVRHFALVRGLRFREFSFFSPNQDPSHYSPGLPLYEYR